jgi:cyclophilin family peptidyl-prolyl cis-trans isomerase
MRNIIIIAVIIIAGVAIASTLGGNKNNNQKENVNQPEKSATTKLSFPGKLPADQIKNKKAVIETDKGTIEIALWADKAPLTVSNFVYLANNGFYNGLTFHRVEPGFVVQGGDPSGNGTGGPGYQFQDEPVVGEYTAGTVAMANSGPNTNGSQFFINLVDNSKNLTKSYNLFGEVTSGMDVVKKITAGDKMNSVKIVSTK